VTPSFPEKLHLMLSEVEGSGLTDIISWWEPATLCLCVYCSWMRHNTQHNQSSMFFHSYFQATSRTMLRDAQAEGVCGGSHAIILPPIEDHIIPASVESVRIQPHYERSGSWWILPWVILEEQGIPLWNDGENRLLF
jgi:hypothetical protein